METKYKIVYRGELQAGFEFEDVVSNLMSITNMDREKAGTFLSADKPTLIKKNLDREQAEKYGTLLKNAGLQIQLISSENKQSGAAASPKAATARKESLQDSNEKVIPSAPEYSATNRKTDSDNPYASPKADLKVDKISSGDWLGKPQKVPASHGWQWIKEATAMFFEHPWMWLGMAVVAWLLTVLVQLIPVIGIIFSSILGMLFGGGLMLTAQSQADGETIRFSYLFKGFSHNRNQLILVGLLYLAGFFVIGLIMAITMGSGMWAMFGVGGNDPEAAVAAMMQNVPMFILAMVIAMVLFIPLIMALWFSTALVAVGDQKAITAYKLSLQACLKNWLPFLVYSLAFLVIGIVVMFAVSAVSGLLAFIFATEGEGFNPLAFFLPFIVMLIIGLPSMVIGVISVFTSYKDIFYKSA